MVSCSFIQRADYVQNCISINFVADNSFSDVEKDMIKRALIKWQDVIGNAIHLTVRFVDLEQNPYWRTDRIPTIYKATDGWKNKLALSLYDRPFLGLAIPESGDIFITHLGSNFYYLILHEVGHVLIGSDWHSLNKKSVMFPYFGMDITKEDINKILRR